MQAFRGERVPWGSWRDYVTLTKPRIMSLLLITGFCGMIAGARGWPGTTTGVVAMLGLALACGGASALNHVLDRDIDPLMGERTKRRPVASGRVTRPCARVRSRTLGALVHAVGGVVNVLTAVLALAGNLFYVLVYTRGLKRRTPQNIVIGGAAGAVPPLVGWAAATCNVCIPRAPFAIVFVWTPPHFWALALLIKENYAAPKCRCFPSSAATARRRGRSCSTRSRWSRHAPPGRVRPARLVYVGSALALGRVRLAGCRLQRDLSPRRAAMLFHYSLLYLALLFAALAIDAVLVLMGSESSPGAIVRARVGDAMFRRVFVPLLPGSPATVVVESSLR